MPRKKKDIETLPEPEIEEPTVRPTYMTGYVINGDKSVMLHIRNLASEKVDYYAKLTKFVHSEGNIIVKHLMCDIVALAVCDYAQRVCLPKDEKTDTAANVAVLTYPDEYGKIHIVLTDNDQKKIADLINRIVATCHIAPEEVVARGMGVLFNIDLASFPKTAEFATIAQPTDVSKSLDEYYIRNETIQCDLI